MLPAAPVESPRPGVPVIATIAPVIGALVLWSITGSAVVLAFAALGPIVAIATMLDARRQARRRRRLAAAERARRHETLRGEIDERQSLERQTAWRRFPSPRAIVEGGVAPDWRDAAVGPVVLGRGDAVSAVRLDGTPFDDADHELLASAARLGDAPVVADPATGIGFVGALPLARAAARSALVQIANRAVPGGVALLAPEVPEWSWSMRLPHHGGAGRLVRVVDVAADGRRRAVDTASDVASSLVLAVASDAAQLPHGLGTIVRLLGPASATMWRAGGAVEQHLAPHLVGRAEAIEWAEATSSTASASGLGSAVGLPRMVRLDAGTAAVHDLTRATLGVTVGAAADGPLVVDLVRHGPHALVAGTTGSGKSEFLLGWLTALASAYPPDLVSFLLVDFKGGAAFDPIRELPQVSGIVTDLDDAEAERAVASLRAELRHREHVLAESRVRDIADLGLDVPLARLILVVDEFQAMIARFPDLGAVIADVAARGRSLGVHLVLASQRPNGVVREQVTANCAIRVSLRVVQRADSIALVGTAAAAEIRPDTPGRGVIDRGDGAPVAFQSALADATVIAQIRERHALARRARRPWLDRLPGRITAEDLAALAASGDTAPLDRRQDPRAPTPATGGEAYRFGLVDEPEHQRRTIASWSPRDDGNLLVLGMPRSGRSTALAALATAVVASHGPESLTVVDGPRSTVWDLLGELLDAIRAGEPVPRLLLIDDLDVRFLAWPDDYRAAALDTIASIAREGRARGLAVAAAAAQLQGLGALLRDGFAERVLLRHPTRSDILQAGGVGEYWHPDSRPGSGQWRGHRVQLVDATAAPAAARHPVPMLEFAASRFAVVSTAAPRADAEALTAAGHRVVPLSSAPDGATRAAVAAEAAHDQRPVVFVGDAEAWAANWALLASIREEAVVIVRGGPVEFRAVVRERALPPLLDEGSAQCWVARSGRPVQRARWIAGRD